VLWPPADVPRQAVGKYAIASLNTIRSRNAPDEVAYRVRFGPIGDVAVSHSITTSARVRKVSGIVSPSAFAVLRLTTSSNLVG
jgi:hypothetical protein